MAGKQSVQGVVNNMNLKLLGLLLLPSIVLANPGLRHHQESPLVPAKVAKADAYLNHRERVKSETDILLSIAKDTIRDGVIEGKYETAFRVTGYDAEAVHAVNQTLRDHGYKIRTFYAREIGERLVVVSWEK